MDVCNREVRNISIWCRNWEPPPVPKTASFVTEMLKIMHHDMAFAKYCVRCKDFNEICTRVIIIPKPDLVLIMMLILIACIIGVCVWYSFMIINYKKRACFCILEHKNWKMINDIENKIHVFCSWCLTWLTRKNGENIKTTVLRAESTTNHKVNIDKKAKTFKANDITDNQTDQFLIPV